MGPHSFGYEARRAQRREVAAWFQGVACLLIGVSLAGVVGEWFGWLGIVVCGLYLGRAQRLGGVVHGMRVVLHAGCNDGPCLVPSDQYNCTNKLHREIAKADERR